MGLSRRGENGGVQIIRQPPAPIVTAPRGLHTGAGDDRKYGDFMRSIMVMNAKGGCGKSTLATSIAAYFANNWEGTVTLADYDPQTSSLDWLAKRPSDRDPIVGVDASKEGLKHLPRNTDYLIIDPPARVHGSELTGLVRHVETIVVPVLPSPIDIGAAAKFVRELQDVGKVERREVKIAVVANRVRENLLVFNELEQF